MYVSSRGAILKWRQASAPAAASATLAPRARYGLRTRYGRGSVPLSYGTTETATQAAGGSGRAKRRYIVKDGDRLLVFSNQQAALEAQKAIDAASKPEAQAKAPKQAQDRSRPQPPEPEQTIRISELQKLANAYSESATLARWQKLQDLEAMVTMYAQLRDEEEIELLLVSI